MDYDYFRSTPTCWSIMNDNLQDWMFHYLNSPINEPELPSSDVKEDNGSFVEPEKDDSHPKLNLLPPLNHLIHATSSSLSESIPLHTVSNVQTTKSNPFSTTHGEKTPKHSNLNKNFVGNTSSFEFYFDIKPFEDHLNNATSHLKDDFSHSSCSSKTSSSEFNSLKWIDNLLEEAYKRLD